MDRRRLEEGFLLFAAVQVIAKYGLPIQSIPYDKWASWSGDNTFHEAFVKKWGGKLQQICFLKFELYGIFPYNCELFF